MPGLFTHIDGIAAILFHVEQSVPAKWRFRYRLLGDLPAPYLVWREKTATGRIARIHSEVPGAVIEVEWAEEEVEGPELRVESKSADDGVSSSASSSGSSLSTLNSQPSTPTWQPVSQLEFTPGSAVFEITAAHDFHSAEGFTVCAPGRNEGVAAYHFPPCRFSAGVPVRLTGLADAPAFANLLLEPGDFRPRISGLALTNAEPSTGSWREVPGHSGPFTLSRCHLAAARRWFAVGRDNVPPGLVAGMSAE